MPLTDVAVRSAKPRAKGSFARPPTDSMSRTVVAAASAAPT